MREIESLPALHAVLRAPGPLSGLLIDVVGAADYMAGEVDASEVGIRADGDDSLSSAPIIRRGGRARAGCFGVSLPVVEIPVRLDEDGDRDFPERPDPYPSARVCVRACHRAETA